MSWQIILQILFITVCAVLTTAESALISLNDTHLEKLAENGSKKAVRLKKLADNPNNFMMSSQIAVKLFEFISAGLAATGFSGRLATLFSDNIPEFTAEIISAIIIMLVMSFLMMTFGENGLRLKILKNSLSDFQECFLHCQYCLFRP